MVNDKQPHSHIFKRVYLIATSVESVEFTHKIVEKLSAVPYCFGKVAAKRLKCVVYIKKRRPKKFELFSRVDSSFLLVFKKFQV